MVDTRIVITNCGTFLYRQLLIATRYAVCRRQFAIVSGGKVERKLIDYRTHLNLIGSQLANVHIITSSRGYLLET